MKIRFKQVLIVAILASGIPAIIANPVSADLRDIPNSECSAFYNVVHPEHKFLLAISYGQVSCPEGQGYVYIRICGQERNPEETKWKTKECSKGNNRTLDTFVRGVDEAEDRIVWQCTPGNWDRTMILTWVPEAERYDYAWSKAYKCPAEHILEGAATLENSDFSITDAYEGESLEGYPAGSGFYESVNDPSAYEEIESEANNAEAQSEDTLVNNAGGEEPANWALMETHPREEIEIPCWELTGG